MAAVQKAREDDEVGRGQRLWGQAKRLKTPAVRDAVRAGNALPKWVPDSEASACYVCGQSFSWLVRRHHCRRCGLVVCGSCSSHSLFLASVSLDEPARVCDPCYQRQQRVALAASQPPRPLAAGDAGLVAAPAAAPAAAPQPAAAAAAEPVAAAAARAPQRAASAPAAAPAPASSRTPVPVRDVRMERKSLSPMLYLLQPLARDGQRVGIGRLYLKVVEAENIPVMDTLNQKADPYCTVALTRHEHRAKLRTSVQKATLFPKWNEEFIVTVENSLSTLVLELFDWDAGSKDDRIGEVRIPLSDLRHQQRFVEWFPVDLDEEVRRGSVLSNMNKSFLASFRGSPSKGEDKVAREAKEPRIRLELQFTYSKLGDFFSHFDPESPKQVPEEKFNVEVLYAQILRFFRLISPLFVFFTAVNDVIAWKRPHVTAMVLVLFWYLCVNPWLFPVFMQLLLLRHILRQLVLSEYRRASEQDRRIELMSDVKDHELNAPAPSKSVEHFGTVLRTFANTTLAFSGWEEYLQYYQNIIKWTNDIMEWIAGLFSWQNPGVTRIVLLTLMATTAYSLWFPFRYIVLIAGLVTLTYFTVPMQGLIFVLASFVAYLTRPSVSVEEIRRKWARTVEGTKMMRRWELAHKGLKQGASAAAAAAAPESESKSQRD